MASKCRLRGLCSTSERSLSSYCTVFTDQEKRELPGLGLMAIQRTEAVGLSN